jgi:hypothetical protein
MASSGSFRSRLIDFDRNFLDPHTPLSCLGAGKIGGKAEGQLPASDGIPIDPELLQVRLRSSHGRVHGYL